LQASKAEMDKRIAALHAAHGDAAREQYYSVAVVGESHKNPDGTSRQAIIKGLHEGDPVLILRDASNTFDPNAVAVCVERRGKVLGIGYLSREDAAKHAPKIDAGKAYRAEVRYVGGGTRDKPSRGVWLDLYRIEPPARRKSKKKPTQNRRSRRTRRTGLFKSVFRIFGTGHLRRLTIRPVAISSKQ
jgi:hypothetical protein